MTLESRIEQLEKNMSTGETVDANAISDAARAKIAEALGIPFELEASVPLLVQADALDGYDGRAELDRRLNDLAREALNSNAHESTTG